MRALGSAVRPLPSERRTEITTEMVVGPNETEIRIDFLNPTPLAMKRMIDAIKERYTVGVSPVWSVLRRGDRTLAVRLVVTCSSAARYGRARRHHRHHRRGVLIMRLSNDVLTVLSGLEIDGIAVRIRETLDRKLYTAVNDVLAACGGTWNKKAKAHLFVGCEEGEVAIRLDTVIVAGAVVTLKEHRKELGLFLTPEPLAAQLVEMADVRRDQIVLEPSAGTGRLVRAAIARRAQVIAVERDPTMRAALPLPINKPLSERPVVLEADDFMNVTAEVVGAPDRVVMNPPFCKSGKGDHLDHVRHAFTFLRKGGVLVSVLPTGVLFRQDRRHREFREWAESIGTLIKLPDGSFRDSGTMVATCVLRAIAT